MIGIDRNANTHIERNRYPVNHKRLFKYIQNAARGDHRAMTVGAGQENRKLVSRETGRDIGIGKSGGEIRFAQNIRETGRNLLQKQVAKIMAKGIVDLFKVI